ncbi:hypothetical protein BU24DRAFT_468155 [Aaosphaeria arxii CBS 175.79]|uniref:RBR-type E3 ubiquitin transferase n=1 Tax=Aaosphaeria arxii CBS 175.79 TaxID=1450172 RepID=A0A6A5X893_9PLEO|nr:uncharacterized protein BU24DRAFT_468155 [Aaosphaeria arxii CBS 175.79]KAF2009162.1 hypothetical protein BU24DRAFT_468155 [Aaosphaeria arxii CBS 175.79]
MGSKLSKAVRRPRRAESFNTMSNSAPAPHSPADQTINAKSRTDQVCQDLSVVAAKDAIVVLPTPSITSPADKLSATASGQVAIEMEHENTQAPDSAPSVEVKNDQALQQDEGSNDPPHSPSATPNPIPKAEASVKIVSCIICCDPFPDTDDTIVRPCRTNCTYCVECLRHSFLKACLDVTRMPPRCCDTIQLHHVRPFLTDEELNTYREKYDEWSTPKPFYCPVPTCSAFISNRILKNNSSAKGKQRVDSVVGTPTSPHIACPKCSTSICTNCRQLEHLGLPCEDLPFGVDKETAALLEGWGYKKCPKCAQGVRRMYGCNHMQCMCGAHWCWACQRSKEECDGECYESDEYSESEFDEEDDSNSPNAEASTSTEPAAAAAAAAATTEQPASTELANATPTARRQRNLDLHSRHTWEAADMDFGDEPSNDAADKLWDCDHYFYIPGISLTTLLTKKPVTMECTKCWAPIHNEIFPPNATKLPFKMTSHLSPKKRWRTRWDRESPLPRRALEGVEGTSSTAPLPAFARRPQSLLEPESEDAVGLPHSDNGDRVRDMNGNIVSSTDWILQPRPQRSLDDLTSAANQVPVSQASSAGGATKLNPTPFSFAYECETCNMLLCRTCKEEEEAESKARKELRAKNAIDET